MDAKAHTYLNEADKAAKIVPKHSAILTAYENASIHATHTDMTKFATKNDTGYVRVSDQLFFWCQELTAPSQDDVRNRRLERFAESSTQNWSGTVNSGSGSWVQGNVQAGGNINFR